VEWGNTDGSLRFYKAEKLVDLFEALHTDHITVATFADESTLITASLDCTVSVWSVDGHSSGPFDVQFTAGLYGHLAPVSILVVSRTLSTILSGSTDGKVIIWDLNSHERLRVLDNEEKVDHAQIDHSSGHILLCSGMTAKLYTINGDLILQQNLCAGLDDHITSCAFYATSSSEWLGGEYIMTGHTQGTAKVSSRRPAHHAAPFSNTLPIDMEIGQYRARQLAFRACQNTDVWRDFTTKY
jgi:WD40 repeat protein